MLLSITKKKCFSIFIKLDKLSKHFPGNTKFNLKRISRKMYSCLPFIEHVVKNNIRSLKIAPRWIQMKNLTLKTMHAICLSQTTTMNFTYPKVLPRWYSWYSCLNKAHFSAFSFNTCTNLPSSVIWRAKYSRKLGKIAAKLVLSPTYISLHRIW